MKQLHHCLFVVLLLPFLIKAQQANTGLVKAKAFYQFRMQGIQMVDDKGEPVQQASNQIHFVVMEVKGTQAPLIDSLFYFGKHHPCIVSGISNPEWTIGKIKRTGKSAAWQVQPQSSLWMIEFVPTIKPMKNKSALFIKGKTGRKKFVTTLSREEELEAEAAQ